MEDFLQNLANLNPLWIYLAVGIISYVENIFPPFPSDILLVAVGSVVGLGKVDFLAVLGIATVTSTLGFATMFKIGQWFGTRILETGKISFIPVNQVRKVEGWFQKYGYGMILANRFLSGARSVISFFAGMSELSLPKTIGFSFLSALVWIAILLFAGQAVGANWERISTYLQVYSNVVTSVVIVVVLLLVARYLTSKPNHRNSQSDDSKTGNHS